jgi:hypothetical protein
VLSGATKGPVGQFDVLIVLARRYNWTPAQVAEMDPDYLEELLTMIRAEDEHEKTRQEREKRKAERKSRLGGEIVQASIGDIE